MKKCSKCNILKEETDFFSDKKAKDKLQSYCKNCKSLLISLYYKNNPEKIIKKQYNSEKGKQNYYKHRVHQNISRLIRLGLNGRKSEKTFNLLGYSLEELKKYLESKFKNGMSWDNYGEWHIDHIIPRDALRYNNVTEINFKKCWDLNNLQPLWKSENFKKSNKIIESVV